MDLQTLPDVIWSSILELTDNGSSPKLEAMFEEYQCWCTELRLEHACRAKRKMFQAKILRPSTTAYTHLSQKFLTGIAARMFIYFLCPLVCAKACENPRDAYAVQLGIIKTFKLQT